VLSPAYGSHSLLHQCDAVFLSLITMALHLAEAVQPHNKLLQNLQISQAMPGCIPYFLHDGGCTQYLEAHAAFCNSQQQATELQSPFLHCQFLNQKPPMPKKGPPFKSFAMNNDGRHSNTSTESKELEGCNVCHRLKLQQLAPPPYRPAKLR